MLKLRKVQLVNLDAAGRLRFEANLCSHLRRSYAEAAELSPEELRAFVGNAVKVARAHGLTWERSIATFVSLMLTVSPRFFAAPAIAQLLRDGGVAPDLRLDLILNLASPQAWEAAAASNLKEAVRRFAQGQLR